MTISTLVWALCGLAIALGLVTIYAGTQPAPPQGPKGTSPGVARFKVAASLQLTRLEKILLVMAVLASLVVAITTGWVIALIIFPVLTLVFPRLLAPQKGGTGIEKLEALGDWTRALSGVLTTNSGLSDSLVATLRSTPAPIKPEVELLVARLQAGRPAPQALWAFADDLDDPAGDLIASTLILGASRSGTGLTKVLKGLAEAVGDEVRVRRTIEAARKGPRKEARLLTILFPLILTGFLVLSNFGQAYTTPIGQVVLAVVITGFIGCLFWMRYMTTAKPEARFLVSDGGPATGAKVGGRS